MDKFTVTLHSRGDRIAHGLIRASYDVHARDDVSAAEAAKLKAVIQFPDRGSRTWVTDKVERKEVTA
jgi:hypothetical protein